MKHPVVPVSATAAAAAAHAAAFNQIKTDMMNSYHSSSHHSSNSSLPPPQMDSNGNTPNGNRGGQVCKYEVSVLYFLLTNIQTKEASHAYLLN